MLAAPNQSPAGLLEALRGVLSQVADPIVVLRAILEQAVARTGADRGVFVEVSGSGTLEYRVLHGFRPGHFDGETGQFSRSLFARALETEKPVVLFSALEDPRYREQQSIQAIRKASILCMPIRADGKIAALVHLENGRPGYFQAEHVEVLRSLSDLAGPLLEALRAGRDVITERDRLRSDESLLREEAEGSRAFLAREWSFGRFVGRSSAVRELETSIGKAAATDFPVLLLGETGTGKSILARVLHHAGQRAQQPMITVFCPSLEKSMVEAELFGHRKGSFTGALSDRLGKVQAADKGTLFLDEIGELPLEIQPKLLRLLQERTFERVGDTQERKADVRVVAATNRDLDVEVREGRFRRDLYERLNFIPIRIPPLRERIQDIPLLLRHCLDQSPEGRWIELAPETADYLTNLDFAWPGNVRHLEQLAARLTVEGKRAPASPAEVARLLGPDRKEVARAIAVEPSPTGRAEEGIDLDAGLPALLEEAERTWLQEALRRYPRLTRAELAAKLKISESALYKKLRAYDLGS
jgi:transcriptional regulator with GAF, ATPase, and Fis domain